MLIAASVSPNPSWGTGTDLPAIPKNSVEALSNPSWGTGTSQTRRLADQGLGPNPHGEREHALSPARARHFDAPNPSWGTGTLRFSSFNDCERVKKRNRACANMPKRKLRSPFFFARSYIVVTGSTHSFRDEQGALGQCAISAILFQDWMPGCYGGSLRGIAKPWLSGIAILEMLACSLRYGASVESPAKTEFCSWVRNFSRRRL